MTFTDPIAWEATLPIRQSSAPWSVTVRSFYGSELTPTELEQWRALTGRTDPPEGGYTELLVVAGRRAGKSETIARLAMFEGCHGGHEAFLAPGQVGLIVVISPLREQSQEILGYVRGLAELPQVAPFVEKVGRDGVLLRTGVEIRVMTADAVSVSGPTVVMAILDEAAKLPGDDAVEPDRAIVNSLRPALAPLSGAPPRRFVMITSAYITEGLAYETDRDHFAQSASDVLVVHGTTSAFNPNIDEKWLERERRRVGERVFAREYLGLWQDAILDGWFGADIIDRCIDKGRGTLEPRPGVRYVAAVDLGVRVDDAALAIAHQERHDDRVVTVIDGIWHWPAGSLPMGVIVARSAKIIKQYRAQAFADQFHYDSVEQDYARNGVRLTEAPWTATGGRSKTIRFNTVRAHMIDGRLRLPDDRDLIREFHNLAGRLRRSGSEELAARSGHDDRLHAVVLATSEVIETQPARTQSPAAWSHEDYIAAKEIYFSSLSQWIGGRHHPVFNVGPHFDGNGHGECLSYPELRRRIKNRQYPFND